jgi:hypothetical protein
LINGGGATNVGGKVGITILRCDGINWFVGVWNTFSNNLSNRID